MTKLEVSQWQFDEIESIVRRNPGGQEWLDNSLIPVVDDNVYPVDEVLYVFFGPLGNMLRWKRENKVEEDPNTFAIVHAQQGRHKVEGSRAKTKRVYDLDGDKDWYWANYHDPRVRETLEAMHILESRYGRAD